MYDPNVSFRQLLCFQRLAESEHLGHTAEELLISPAALSGLIKRLEQEIGKPLFTRTGRNIRLNEAGRILYNHVENMMNELQEAKREIGAQAEDREKFDLTVGVATPGIWKSRVLSYAENNPSVRMTISVLHLSQLSNSYETAGHDLIIAASDDLPASKYDSVRLVTRNTPLLVTNKNHPLASRKSIDLIEVKEEPFILLLKEYSFRSYCEQLFSMAGFRPKVAMECDYQFMPQMMKNQYGLIISTEMAIRTDAFDEAAVYIPISNPAIPRTFAVFWDKRRELTPAAKDFIQYLESCVEPSFN